MYNIYHPFNILYARSTLYYYYWEWPGIDQWKLRICTFIRLRHIAFIRIAHFFSHHPTRNSFNTPVIAIVWPILVVQFFSWNAYKRTSNGLMDRKMDNTSAVLSLVARKRPLNLIRSAQILAGYWSFLHLRIRSNGGNGDHSGGAMGPTEKKKHLARAKSQLCSIYAQLTTEKTEKSWFLRS